MYGRQAAGPRNRSQSTCSLGGSGSAAAQPLANLLQKPGMAGHAYLNIEEVAANIPASHVDTATREQSLRELILARALYRCGDHNGLGEKILNEYARDLRGHYARHALAILKEEPGQN